MPSIDFFEAWITYHQYRIQKYRLIYDSRNKRIVVFYAVRQLIRDVCSQSKANDIRPDNYRLSAAEAPYFFNTAILSYMEGLEMRFLRMLELKDRIDDKAYGEPEALEQAKRELREIRKSMCLEHGRLQAEFRPYLELPASYLGPPEKDAVVAAQQRWLIASL
jgi:hypothetical protein